MVQNIEHQSRLLKHRYSFYQLFKEDRSFRIEIPIIQRDYAQGRKDQEVVRHNFLEILYEYLDENKPYRDLDFIYGTIVETKEGVKFIPLDGQQRLTTLFLLHWYLANISGCYDDFCDDFMNEGVTRFSYETRVSSSEFCTAIVTKQHKLDFHQLTEGSFSKTIQNQCWFFKRWLNDPTIASMLVMLEAMHHKFEKRPEFYQRLTQSPQIITFHFLNLGEFNLTDDLYIKMNARGKLLNDFENFKSQFEKEISHYRLNDAQYSLVYGDQIKKVSAVDYFKQKIDTDWLGFLWAMVNQVSQDITADRAAINLIYHLIATYHYVNSHQKSDTLHRFLIGSGGSYNACSFTQYNNDQYFSEELLLEIITMFDLITLGAESRQKCTILNDKEVYNNFYFNRDKILTDITHNKASYPDRLLFYAFYQGIRQNKDKEEMIRWLRVIFNLVHNSIFDSPQSYQRGLKSITELSKKETLIWDLLKKGIDHIEGFNPLQKKEEEIKAWLMTTSTYWRKNIESVEQHSFFLGQIGFLLNFSGITDYYSQYKTTNWGDNEKTYQSEFDKYQKAASQVFSSIEQSSQSIDYLWERAVLTKGFYLTKASNSRYNLLSTRLSKNNIERDHSWKLLLRYHARKTQDGALNPWFIRQSYIKAVLDDPCFNEQNDDVSFKKGLQVICDNFLKDHSYHDWRPLLIAEPKLFEVCEQGFIAIEPEPSLINEDEAFKQSVNYLMLFHQSQWNHYHSELYTLFLYYLIEKKINEKTLDISPLKPSYESQKSGELLPLLKLEWQDHVLAITNQGGQYQLCYDFRMDKDHQDIDPLSKRFKNNGFRTQEDNPNAYLKECKTIDSVLNEILIFSQIIRSMINE